MGFSETATWSVLVILNRVLGANVYSLFFGSSDNGLA